MTSFFELDSSFLFDPSSQMEETPSSFLSFSSFAALANIATSPWSPSWDSDLSHPEGASEKTSTNSNKRKAKSYFPHFSDSDSAYSPSHSDATDRSHGVGSLEPVTPHLGDVGLFDSEAGSSTSNKASSGLPESFTSLRSSTPTLLSKESIESIATVVGSASSSARRKASVTPSPLRTASNPVLGSTYRRPVKPIASMPALNEDDTLGAVEGRLFDGLDMTDVFGINGFAATSSKQIRHDSVNDDVLAEDFEWVFGGYGLGGSGSSSSSGSASVASTGIVPAESTIFAAFQDGPASTSTTDQFDVTGVDSSFYGSFDSAPTFTIDPMEFIGSMATENGLAVGTIDCRPSSAPGLIGVGSGQMLSIPMGDMMSRSASSDSMFSIHSAPSQDSYSYMPPSTHAGPSYSQPLYPTESSADYKSASPVDALIALPVPSPKSRRVSKPGLSINIHPRDQMTSYRQPSSLLPPTPTSATFADMSYQQHPQPLPMSRGGSHPLPSRRKSSNGAAAQPAEVPMPPVVARAAAIVAMQEAKQEQQRQELRRQAASRRAGMTDASVLQPYMINSSGVAHPSQISGWTGVTYPVYPVHAPQMAYAMSHPQPVVTVHPPPMQMYGSHTSHVSNHPLHRVHPPPYPAPSASTTRPISRMPSTPTRTRKPSNSPSKRTPKKRSESATAASGAGGFSWGAATFINFTPDDAETLLGGVAPSGSQSKRKREDEERAQDEGMMVLGERKRSRS